MSPMTDGARAAGAGSAPAALDAELSDEELEMVIGGLSRIPPTPLDPRQTER